MSDLGFKSLSTENWLVPDSTTQAFVRLTSDGQVHTVAGDEWLGEILRPRISPAVPIEVRKLFEVARGAMAYGCFFYPLYTLGIEQLFRVAEAAVTHKCKAMAAPSSVDGFAKKVRWLIEKGVIPQQDAVQWEGIRGLRNISSHPEMQSIFMPTEALRFIESMAEHINSLFSSA